MLSVVGTLFVLLGSGLALYDWSGLHRLPFLCGQLLYVAVGVVFWIIAYRIAKERSEKMSR